MTDTPCTPEQRAAIVASARDRVTYLIRLADRMLTYPYPAREDIAATIRVIHWITDGDKWGTVRNPIRESPDSQTPDEGR